MLQLDATQPQSLWDFKLRQKNKKHPTLNHQSMEPMFFFSPKWKAISGLHEPLSNLTGYDLEIKPDLPCLSTLSNFPGFPDEPEGQENTQYLSEGTHRGPWYRTSPGNLGNIRTVAADSCVRTWGWERIHDTLSKLSHFWSGFHHKGWIYKENTRAPARNAKTKNYSSFYRSVLCKRTFCDYGNVFFLWCPTP